MKLILNKTKGFSLIELIVAVSIIIIITSVALFHQAQFSSDILISNAAYELALTIRQAQVFGISSRGVSAAPNYRAGYGIHIGVQDANTKPDFFQMFIDAPRYVVGSEEDAVFNFYYNPPAGTPTANDDAEVTPPSPISLTQGQLIRRFCARNAAYSTGGWECWNKGDTPKTLDIVFVKPNPDANIVFFDGTTRAGNCEVAGQNPGCTNIKIYDQAKIVIESGLGDKCRTVRIFAAGQIAVDATDSTNPAGCDWDPEK